MEVGTLNIITKSTYWSGTLWKIRDLKNVLTELSILSRLKIMGLLLMMMMVILLFNNNNLPFEEPNYTIRNPQRPRNGKKEALL